VSDTAEAYDTRFSLPGVEDPPSTEIGVMLLGLDAERLLAGLGMAEHSVAEHSIAEHWNDTARVTLLVDQARHGVLDGCPLTAAVAAGARRWRDARPALAAAADPGPPSAALRQAWAQTYRTVATTAVCQPESAAHSYLTACWLRRDEVDRHTG
jgi:hypothetical protein